jgi:hypothetical protein
MTNHVLFMGWNEAKQGREKQAAELFPASIAFWTNLQKEGMIDSFEPVLLQRHGGDMNGFFLIKGDRDKLHEIQNRDEYMKLVSQLINNIDGFGVINGWTNEELQRVMKIWSGTLG